MAKKITKKINPLIYGVIVLSVIATVFVGMNIITIMNKTTISGQGKESNKLKNEHYVIGNNATALQKDIFNLLTEKLNDASSSDIEKASLVAQSFISDLFTWTNKDGNYDVGGKQYVYGSALDPFNIYVRDTLYSQLDIYIAQYGREYLPEVSSINAEAFESGEFSTYFGEYPSYYVYVNWEYKQHTVKDDSTSKIVDTDGFPKEMNVYLIKTPEGRFEIVQFLENE